MHDFIPSIYIQKRNGCGLFTCRYTWIINNQKKKGTYKLVLDKIQYRKLEQ